MNPQVDQKLSYKSKFGPDTELQTPTIGPDIYKIQILLRYWVKNTRNWTQLYVTKAHTFSPQWHTISQTFTTSHDRTFLLHTNTTGKCAEWLGSTEVQSREPITGRLMGNRLALRNFNISEAFERNSLNFSPCFSFGHVNFKAIRHPGVFLAQSYRTVSSIHVGHTFAHSHRTVSSIYVGQT